MKTNMRAMHELHAKSLRVRQAIVTNCPMHEDALHEASIMLEMHYADWCSEHQRHDVADSLKGLGEMLRQRPLPWAYIGEDCLSGLTSPQLYLAWAYGEINFAIELLATRLRLDRQADLRTGSSVTVTEARESAKYAAKALAHAKRLSASDDNRLAQACC